MTVGRDPAILVVDDESAVQRLLVKSLERSGYADVKSASSVEEASNILSTSPVDLVLTDMQMPGESGLDLLEQIRGRWPDVASMMVTGRDDAELADRALDMGAYGYIIKPFKHNEVVINVGNALRRQRLEQDNAQHRDQLEEKVKERTNDLWSAVTQLEQAQEDLERSHSETIRRLAIAAEFRDEETGRHVARMSLYCELLAGSAGYDSHASASIRAASQMHDVGKIGVPDSILLKPLGLTAEEQAVMQRHAEIGHKILGGSDSPLLDLAATIAWTHHEKFDGNGYPRGLSGTEIPIEGRIAAICDVFDALTTNRVYRRAYPVGAAVEMMKDARGEHFDPKLLDLFLEHLPEVLDIRDRHDPGGLSPAASVLGDRGWEDLR